MSFLDHDKIPMYDLKMSAEVASLSYNITLFRSSHLR